MANQPSTDKFPPVTTSALLRAIFWRKWVGIVTGAYGLFGLLDVFDSKIVPKLSEGFQAFWGKYYVLGVFDLKTWVIIGLSIIIVVSLLGAYQFARDYHGRYEKLTERKLVFEIDRDNTKVRVEQTKSAIRIFLDVRLRFENMCDHSLYVKQLLMTLHRGGVEGVRAASDVFAWFGILRVSSDGVQINKKDIEGMLMQEHRLSPFYLIEAMLAIEDEQIKTAKDLNVTDYIEITMHSSGYQPEFIAKLHPYWDAALKDGGTNQIVVTGAETVSKDIRRID